MSVEIKIKSIENSAGTVGEGSRVRLVAFFWTVSHMPTLANR